MIFKAYVLFDDLIRIDLYLSPDELKEQLLKAFSKGWLLYITDENGVFVDPCALAIPNDTEYWEREFMIDFWVKTLNDRLEGYRKRFNLTESR